MEMWNTAAIFNEIFDIIIHDTQFSSVIHYFHCHKKQNFPLNTYQK